MNALGARKTAWALLVLLGFSLRLTPALAQQGIGVVRGTVVDGETGESLIGVNIILQNTATGTTTDLNGNYELRFIEPGTFTLVFSYIGYDSKTVANVEVLGGTVRLDLALSPEAIGLGDILVEARAIRNSEAVLLRDRQKAVAFSDAISAEAISRSGSGDAAGAMTKVTGASVVGGKYVYIRGLGDRYTSTHLNGAELPSADPDKKAFQLDLFPASLLDNIVTLKTFTPDKPGNFSGGLVNIGTKSFPDAFTFQLSTTTSFNTQSTFSDQFLSYDGGGTDWLGYDDGMRAIPSLLARPDLEIPSELEALRDPEKAVLLDAASRSFNNIMSPTPRTAPINRSMSIAVGNQMLLLGRPFGFTGSLTYSQDYSAYEDGTVGRWELVGGSVDNVDALTALRFFGNPEDVPVTTQGLDQKGTYEVNWGGLGTLAYKPHPNHELTATYMRTQSGTSESRFLSGYWQDLTGESTFETRVLGYKERTLNSLQFKGKHALPRVTAEWNGSYAQNRQEEPDLRYFSNHFTIRDRDGQVDTLYQSPASLYPAPTRFFRDLEEENVNLGLDLTIPFKQWNEQGAKLKAGGSHIDITRTFRERRFEYKEGRGFSYGEFGGNDLAYFGATGIIDTTTSGRPVFGNIIKDASSARSNYDGDQTVTAFYGMLELPVTRRFKVIGGTRLEITRMETASQDTTLPVGNLRNNDWLPSANAFYELADNMNLRAAFTRTLARPTFRELAPYATFDFVGDFVFRGNANLKRTLITNYDVRWEWFMRPGEILAVSAFYKDFQNPIERVIQTSTGNNSLSVQNVDQARVYGFEFEARKQLDRLMPLLRNFQFGGNFSVVRSEVSIPEEELNIILAADPGASDTRSLEGQSPFLVNLDLSYENPNRGSVIGLYYNIFGERLVTVSEGAAPDIFERARTTIDLTYSQRVKGGVSVKLSVKNLLDADIKVSQQFKDVEYIYGKYRRGRTFSISLRYAIR